MSTPLYTTTATSTGEGRAGGRATTDDGLLDLTLALPVTMGGPGGATNPEQLFAAGWASCFHSALKLVAAQRRTTIADSTVTAEVSIGKSDDGALGLSAALTVHFGAGIDQQTADDLAAGAHQVCPYSNATRGNVPVTLTTTVA
ncbi:organic hydroperoxide resistance protein [Microbacterium sp. NPDC058342]|uniref:organic hydroperoxide resistance protein n=1 Tax=Microbacterium sp. NPDC058342 TaxID=3346454 RepID=UPI00366087BF